MSRKGNSGGWEGLWCKISNDVMIPGVQEKHTACKVSDARDAEVSVESFDL